uniref:AAA+ ATPase domain-containing protein n=1 Tax=Oryza punctata TaxID=4537 RepID=A0A0E0LLC4_ORYPU
MDLSSAAGASTSYAKAVDTYRKAVATAATVTAYAMLARGVARELVPHDLRAAVSWTATLVRRRLGPRPAERRTVIIRRIDEDGRHDSCFADAHAYLATKIDPRTLSRFRLSGVGGGGRGRRNALSMVPGDSMTDVFEGVEFRWTSVISEGGGKISESSLELSFDAEHTDMALGRYVPFITEEVEQARRRDCELKIYMNEGSSWRGIVHHHPATFDTLAMDPELKQSVVADLDRFLKRKEYYRRIGKAWKRGYLLYGPPGTGKSSLVAAMANYLRFNLYDLDLSEVHSNSALQRLLIGMPNRSILVVEDIDCCFSARSREDGKERKTPTAALYGGGDDGDEYYDEDEGDWRDDFSEKLEQQSLTLSGLLNFIDGLWSTSGEERVIVFTTNYKDRLDAALLRPGRMDMHVYMGYCGWDAFKTLAHNYFLIGDHLLFPEIQELISEVEVTPAEVSEMLLRSEDVDAALGGLVEFLVGKKQAVCEGK